MKRITIVLLLSFAAISVSATEWSGACNQQINWSLSTTDSVLRLTGSGSMPDYTTDTRPPWYPYRQYIGSLTMTPAITTVGTLAFADLYALRRAQLADSIHIIKDHGCSNCTLLRAIDIPNRTDTLDSYCFYNCMALEQCRLGSSVRMIAYRAFSYTTLHRVHFPEGLEMIDAYAFANTPTDTIYVPASVRQINHSAWRSCSQIDTIWVSPANTWYDSRESCSAIIETATNVLFQGSHTGTIPAGIPEVGSYAFQNMSRNTRITFPNSVNKIGRECFSGITKVLYNDHLFAHLPESYQGSYTIPDGIETIGNDAFNSNLLSAVVIPPSVNTIETCVFHYCTNLTEIVIPNTVRQIGSYALEYCTKLTSVQLPDSLIILNYGTLRGCVSLESITLPSSLRTIDGYCFNDCSNLRSIVIPDKVENIYSYAFGRCTRLKSITIPCNMRTMIESAFNECDSICQVVWNVRTIRDFTDGPFMKIAEQITDFTFGDSVKYIPSNLCANMVNLRTLSIGQQVEQIAPYAFDGCTGLRHVTWSAKHCADFDIYDYAPFYSARDSITHITLTETVNTIPAYLCMNLTGIRTLEVPASVRKIGPYAFRGCYNLDTIVVASANAYYDSRSDCNALCETATNTLMVGCNNTRIPSSIHHIGESAFRRCIRLQHIDLPSCLQTIGREAFHACESLKKAILPIGIRQLEDYTFTACTGLDSLICGDSLRSIGIRAIAGCTSLKHMLLPASLRKMDLYAFAGCSTLERIDLIAPIPPTVYSNTFDNTTCTFYTPCAYLADYLAAEDWNLYQERLVSRENYELEIAVNDLALGMATIVQTPACLVDAIVEAVPEDNAEFVEWQNEHKDRVSTDNPYQFAVNRDMQLIAIFRAKENPKEGLEQVLREGTKVEIYTLTGTKVYEGPLPLVETLRQVFPQGVYVLRSETNEQKILL